MLFPCEGGAMVAVSRRALALPAAVLVFGLVVPGCSGIARQDTAAAATSGETPTFASVQHSSIDVTVENQAGQPLVDVVIAIKPIGRSPYTKEIRRVENGQKRSFSLSEFTGNDGTPFSLRLARPKEITVTAVDALGKKVEMTTPW
jgi:hypothetical protein